MTNEELVTRIQAGERRLLPDLWDQVEGLVKWQAHRTMAGMREMAACCGVEFDDLYQSGYLALVKAVDTYKDDVDMTFAGWLIFYLRTAFAEATGFRTEKQRRDPLRFSISLNAPVKDEDGATVEDLQADPQSGMGFENVEQGIYIHGLREALGKSWRKSRHGKPKSFGNGTTVIFPWNRLLTPLASALPVFGSWKHGD